MRAIRHSLHPGPARWLVAALLATLLLPSGAGVIAAPSIIQSDTQPETRAREAYGDLPLAFEANQGQANPAARFLAHGHGYSLALAPDAITLGLPTPLRFTFPGARPDPALDAESPLPGIVNYFVGNDPARWHTNVPTSTRVRYSDLYPGIDFVIYGAPGGAWEYDVVVAPGADPAAFALSVEGATSVTLDATTGDLVLATPAGEMRQHAPTIYQEVGGERQSVAGGYALRDGTVGFRVEKYDRALPLVIDPTLVYSTYLGGSGYDQGSGIAVDTSGNAYVTGNTFSTNFPVTNNSTFGGGSYDAFVTKLDGNGARVYSTYLGGSDLDFGNGIAVDANGNAFVTGLTTSTNFPVTNGSALGGSEDAFLTKLDGSGVRVYSTYLGGGNADYGTAIAVDTSGNVYVTGLTRSTNFPVTNGSILGGYSDAFVIELTGSGARLYGTYLGGSGQEIGTSIAVDGGGNAYVTGNTTSANFPVTNGSSYGGGGNEDAFVTKLDSAGARIYSTYLGGSGDDQGTGIAVDANGNAYITGHTTSPNFPVTNGSTYGGFTDVFVTKLDGSGTRLYSIYLGGGNVDDGAAIAVDTSGNAYVTGFTKSMNFPVSGGAILGGATDAFVTKLTGSGTRMYSIYLGGSGDDQGTGIAVDMGGNAYVAGYTASTNFPVTNGSSYGGGTEDSFVTKIPASRSFPSPLPPPQPGPVPSGQPAPAPRPQPAAPVTGAPSPLPPPRL